MPGKLAVAGRGSNAVKAIEVAWGMLRRVEPSIPAAVLTLVDARSRRRVKGYFLPSVWKKPAGKAHEIAVSPELLSDPADLLHVLLHEAAHAVLSDAGDNGA